MIGLEGNWADGLLILAIGVYLALRETLHRLRRRCPGDKSDTRAEDPT